MTKIRKARLKDLKGTTEIFNDAIARARIFVCAFDVVLITQDLGKTV